MLAGLLGGLLLAGFVVMQPFMAAIAWAAIFSYVSWPLHLRFLAWLGGRRSWAALAMTVMLTLVLGLSLLWLGLLLHSEGVAAMREAAALLEKGMRLPEPILNIAWLGPRLQERLTALSSDRAAWGAAIAVVSLIPFGAPAVGAVRRSGWAGGVRAHRSICWAGDPGDSAGTLARMGRRQCTSKRAPVTLT